MFGSNNGIKPGFRRAPARFQSGARQVLPQPAASPSITQILNGTQPPLAQRPGMTTPPLNVNPVTPDVMPMPRTLPAPTGPTPSPVTKTVGMKKGGKVKASSASKRADGIAQRGKTKGKMI